MGRVRESSAGVPRDALVGLRVRVSAASLVPEVLGAETKILGLFISILKWNPLGVGSSSPQTPNLQSEQN